MSGVDEQTLQAMLAEVAIERQAAQDALTELIAREVALKAAAAALADAAQLHLYEQPTPPAAPVPVRKPVPKAKPEAAGPSPCRVILDLLANGPLSKTQLMEGVGCSDSSFSRYIAQLRDEGLVQASGPTRGRVFYLARAAPAADPGPPAPAVPEREPVVEQPARTPEPEPPVAPAPVRRATPPEPHRAARQLRGVGAARAQVDARVLTAIKRGARTRKSLIERLSLSGDAVTESVRRLEMAGEVVATGQTRARQFHPAEGPARTVRSLDAALGSAPESGMTVTDLGKRLGLPDDEAALAAANKMVAAGRLRRDDDGRLHAVRGAK